MAKDFYAILGVAKTASESEIKAAYRKLSRELHPDKHKGDKTKEAKFKEVNEAYEVLSDAKKRQAYDQFGSTNGNPFGAGFGGFQDFDSSSFGGGFGDIFEAFFGGQRGARPRESVGQGFLRLIVGRNNGAAARGRKQEIGGAWPCGPFA